MLATLEVQIDDLMLTHESFMRNYATSPNAPRTLARPAPDLVNQPIDRLLPDFERATLDCSETSGDLRNGSALEGDRFVRSMRSEGGSWFVGFRYRGRPVPLAKVLRPRAPGTDQGTTAEKSVIEQPAGACGELRLAKLLDPIFAQEALEIFDMLIVADGNGTVMYRYSPKETSDIGESFASRSGDDALVITNLTSLNQKKGWRELSPISASELAGVTRHMAVTVSNNEYDLFTQPYAFEGISTSTAQSAGAAHTAGNTATNTGSEKYNLVTAQTSNQWIIAGVVSKSRFTYDALAVSPSVIMFVVAGLVLAICAWPFLRLSLIGEHQPLTLSDVVLVGYSTLVAAAIMTLSFIDYLAYDRMSAIVSRQTSEFAKSVAGNLRSDILLACALAEELRAWSIGPFRSNTSIAHLADVGTSPPVGGVQSVLTLPAVQGYPYVSSFSWVDSNGLQRFKGAMKDESPLISVASRAYFRETAAGRFWRIAGADGVVHKFYLESVRSLTTGTPESVLAIPTGLPDLPVFSVTTQMMHVAQPVLPPSYRFAVIDAGGNVIFHSDEQRNGAENFFAETDFSRELRSAVAARHQAILNIRYWGRDQRAIVIPLQDLPWSLVVFRDKALLRSVNLEIVFLTVLLLLANSAIYAIAFFVIAIAHPAYRAPSVWPVASNADLYRLCVLAFLATSLAAVISILTLTFPRALLVGFAAPAQAIAAMYLILNAGRKLISCILVGVGWAAATLLWVRAVCVDPLETILVFVPGHVGFIKVVVFALLTFAAAAAFVPRSLTSPMTILRFPRSYVVAGLLLLVISSVVPTVAFFKTAARLELEGLVKYAQLVLAGRLERRINRIDRLSIAEGSKAQLAYPIPSFFATSWCLSYPGGTLKNPQQDSHCDVRCDSTRRETWIPESVERFLPQYSDQSVSIRHLHSDIADDGSWRWCRSRDRLMITRSIRLLPDVTVKMFTSEPPDPKVVITSVVPPLFLNRLIEPSGSQQPIMPGLSDRTMRWIRNVLVASVAITIARMLLMIVAYVTKKIFLIDVDRPLWLSEIPLSPSLGDHIFLSHNSRDIDELTKNREGRPVFFDVSFERLTSEEEWSRALAEIDASATATNVRITDFEHNAGEAKSDMRKLEFLEALVSLPNRTIIVASRVTPSFVLATASDDRMCSRWRALFDSFVWITQEQLKTERDVALSDARQTWLSRETAWDPYLKQLAREVPTATGPRAVVDEMQERARTYYSGVWASCSNAEKLLLYQLARHGLMNGKARRLVRRIMARGLVRRAPNLQLFSETFRMFVLEVGRRIEREALKTTHASAWDNLRVPLLVVLLSTVLLVFTTQKDLMNATAGIVTALATGLPAIAKLVGVFTERRTASAEVAQS